MPVCPVHIQDEKKIADRIFCFSDYKQFVQHIYRQYRPARQIPSDLLDIPEPMG